MPTRGHARTAPPYPRFRCLVCLEFVVGTAAGHCPKCGFVPPAAPPLRVEEPDLTRSLVVLGLALVGLAVAIIRAL